MIVAVLLLAGSEPLVTVVLGVIVVMIDVDTGVTDTGVTDTGVNDTGVPIKTVETQLRYNKMTTTVSILY